jgi:RNA polymerase sigma-70 factor (ECF subfamily)
MSYPCQASRAAAPAAPLPLYSCHLRVVRIQDRPVERDETIGVGDSGEGGVSSVELVRRAREGDRQAMDRLFERYLPILRRWAAGRLPRWARDHVDTDDLVQDTLIKTLRNVESFVPRHDGALAAYLRQAMNNRVRDEIRKWHARPAREEMRDDPPGAGTSPLEEAVGQEALRRYEGALERLGAEDRELVLARIEMGLTYEEVAAATGRPSPDAARMAVGRALVRLAQEMDRE